MSYRAPFFISVLVFGIFLTFLVGGPGFFHQNTDKPPGAHDGCVISGCSGQVCGNKSYVTTCEWLPQYSCYDEGICEKQLNGRCGWTKTKELKSCLSSK